MEVPTSPPQTPTQEFLSWWIWSAWLKLPDSCRFAYGCAAQSQRVSGWADERIIDTAGASLIISQSLVSDAKFREFRGNLNEGVLRLEELQLLDGQDEPKPEQQIAASREVLQECLGHGRARTTLYYTLPDPDAFGGDGKLLMHLLATLKEELNLPFKDHYAGRLGNFEIFHLAPWLEAESPVIIEFSSDNRNDNLVSRMLEICRTIDLAKQKHIAHLVCRSNNDVIVDRLINLSPGETRQVLPLPEAPDKLELWLFEGNADAPLFYERSTFLRQIEMVTSALGHTVNIQDSFSARAKQNGESVAKQITNVTSTSPQRSVIGGNPKGSWRAFSENMQNFALHHTADVSDDRWFPKGIEGEIGAIAHLNHILNGGRVQKAILVDPWFGSQSVARFLIRLRSTNLHLTIITSWTSKNPDTNAPVAFKDNPTAELEISLNNVRHLLNPAVTVINLVDGQEQAFHDRYLLVYPHDGMTKTFLLSNSINKMAGNWPFAMSLITSSASSEVQHYIEGLCRSEDTARRRALRETFRWSPNEK